MYAAFLTIAGACGVLALGYRHQRRAMAAVALGTVIAVALLGILDRELLWLGLLSAALCSGCVALMRQFQRRVSGQEALAQQHVEAVQAERVELLRQIDQLREEAASGERTVRQLGELYDFSKAINASLDFASLFEWLAYMLIRYFPCQRCTLILFNPSQGYPVIERVYFTSDQGLPTVRPEPELDAVEQRWVDLARGVQGLYSVDDAKAFPLRFQQDLTGLVAFTALGPGREEQLNIVVDQFARGVEKVRLYERVQEMAIVDYVTQAASRRHLMERLEEEIQRAGRLQQKLSLLILDVDQFKGINDQYGHLVGDAVLREVARVVKSNVREVDLIARYGGDEFAALLPQSGLAEATQVGERIRAAVHEGQIQAYDERLQVTVSIGAAEWTPELEQSQQLIDAADQAMYEAKRRGRNQVWPARDSETKDQRPETRDQRS